MKILLIGDIFARPGRRAVRELLPGLVREYDVDMTIINAENAAGGFGTTKKIADELFGYGADVLTGGNHTFDKAEFLEVLEDNERVLRPHNYPTDNPGAGIAVLTIAGVRVGVLNLQGRIRWRGR
jgi:calcineurin-like phosphoesterase